MCGNCGDDSGWLIWHTFAWPVGVPHLRNEDATVPVRVWAACADCNDDGLKPKPECCEGCGEKLNECCCPLKAA
jgi:hypothetical protein